jgi:hypothetical protein
MSGHFLPDAMMTDGVAAFRCFRFAPSGGGYLESLTRGYRWTAGPQEADQVPTLANTSGLWGFKTLPEAIYQEGAGDDRVFALTEHWEEMIEYETGLRSQLAEIMAFIEPVRPAQLAAFAQIRQVLARNYPDVPVIHRRDIAAKIQELVLVTLPKAAPSPLMQWLAPDGKLVWAPETIGPPNTVENADQSEMLPAAVSYPDETHLADQRLRKVSYEDAGGDRYVFWELVGVEGSDALTLVRPAAESMYRHRVQ